MKFSPFKETKKAQSFFNKIKKVSVLRPKSEDEAYSNQQKDIKVYCNKGLIEVRRKGRKIFSFKNTQVQQWYWDLSAHQEFLCFYGEYLHTDISRIYLVNLKTKQIVKRWVKAFASIVFDNDRLLVAGRVPVSLSDKYYPAVIDEVTLKTLTETTLFESEQDGVISYIYKAQDQVMIEEIQTQMRRIKFLEGDKVVEKMGLHRWQRQEIIVSKGKVWRMVQTTKSPHHQLQSINLNKESFGKSINFPGWVTVESAYSDKSAYFILSQLNGQGQKRIVVMKDQKQSQVHELPLGSQITEMYYSEGKYLVTYRFKSEEILLTLDCSHKRIKSQVLELFDKLNDLNITFKKTGNCWMYIYQLGNEPLKNRATIIYTYGGFCDGSLSNPMNYYGFLKSGGIVCEVWPRGQIHESFRYRVNSSRGQKQRTVNDVIAATKFLIKKGISAKGRIGLNGASNGGFVVGAVLNKAPQLYSAVVTEVGVMDLCNYDLYTGGDVWVCEYGQDKRALRKISPIDNISDKPYPPVYVVSGKYDTRVSPIHQIEYAKTLRSKGHKVYFQQFNQGHSINSHQMDLNITKFFVYHLNK